MINPFESHLKPLLPGGWQDDLQGAPLPLAAIQPLWPEGAPLPGRACVLVCEGVRIAALEGAPVFVDLVSRGWVTLLWVAEGELELIQGSVIRRARAGDGLVVPPGRLAWRSGAYSLVAVLVPPRCLQAARDALLAGEAGGRGGALEGLRLISGDGAEACQASLLAVLRHTLVSMALLQAEVPGLPERLGLADQLLRLLALLRWPELLALPVDRPPDAASAADDRGPLDGHAMADSFEALLAFIRDHLDSPLNLSVLESQSHYSRRSLQYAFRERLGCTATQWIRAQRLDRAYERLIQAGETDTVAGIARACGYRSMGLFSVEFQQRFHVKPSLLLRQSRLLVPVAAPARQQAE